MMTDGSEVIGRGYADGRKLTVEEITELVGDGFDRLQPDGKRILVIIPDGTRSVPLDVMFPVFYRQLKGRARQLDYLVALGTHPPMSPEKMAARVGLTPAQL